MKTNNSILYIVIAVLLLVVFFQTCRSGCNPNKPVLIKTDTVFASDTVYKDGPLVKVPVYIPGKNVYIPGEVPPASESNTELKSQYEEIARKYYSTTLYKDSLTLRDSLGKDVGQILINDSVSKNAILARDINYKLRFPTITNTNTITNTVTLPSKGQVYIGGQVLGNQNDFINGANALLLYKNKRDVIYGISGGLQSNNNKLNPQYGIILLKKIKL